MRCASNVAGVADLLERSRIDVERLDVAEQSRSRARDRRVVDFPRVLRHRTGGLEHAMSSRADGSASVTEGCTARRTVTPPRSNGMLSTTVVRVRAIPGVALEAREQLVEMLRRAGHDLADEALLAGDRMHFADFGHLAEPAR